MDGYTLLRQCKADDRLKQIPFVVYTATYTDPKSEQLALSLGADAFILKPAEPADFIARISQVVAAAGKKTAIQTPASAAPIRIPIAIPEEEEAKNLRLYSEVLIHKLEDKMEELDKANRELQRDIAEHKQMQKRLGESERKARAIFDRSFGFMGLLTPDGSLVEANRSALDFAGVQLSDVAGKPFWETPWWIHSMEAQERIRAAVRAAASGELVRFETTHLATDGMLHTIDVSLKPLRDEAGQVVLLIHEGRDITDRKRAEEAHARLATAVEQAAEAIVITDTSGQILYVNPAFEKTAGYPREEAVGKNPRILKSGKHDNAFYRQMWETLTQGKVWSGRIINKKKNGALYEEEMTISPIRDSAGKVINYVAVNRDVTQEVVLEEQLRQAQKMESIGQLAGGVAHDFNNILVVIQGNASLLLEAKNLSEAEVDLAKQIINAAERAAGLTRQLLVFSRKQVMQPDHLNLNQVVGDMTKMLQRILGEDIALRSDYSPNLPLVFADAGMIEQVLLNLAVNARDAMPRGGRLMIATVEKTLGQDYAQLNPAAAPGQWVCLSVTDTGCGITPGNLSRIFEPFFTTKETGKGTGLGLATVYAIVKQHHGWVEVDSQVDKGTTFRIHLPAAKDIHAKQKATAVTYDLPRGNEVILIVEDEQTVRLLVGNLLQRCGYTVLLAVSGIEAFNLWKQHKDKIQLLLTDMVLPDGMMGRELAEKLQGEKPQLKVVYTSGYSASVVGKGPALVEGVNFLQKPYHPQKLAQTVRDCLDQKEAGG
jgi:PAS domain S-box-containing protein